MPSVFFHTFGCRVNQYETESVREQLLKIGYKTSRDFIGSDVCVINSCSVTAEADKKCRQYVRRILRSNGKARILVTGCYATRDPEPLRKISPRIEIISNQDKKAIPEVISGCSLTADQSSLLTFFHGHTRAFVKVQDGCDATCTYCIIPKVRPRMESRPIREILAEIRSLTDRGYREIVLTGIRLGSYGLTGSGGRVGKVRGNLADLLRQIVELEGNFRVRLSSLEITEMTDELIECVLSSNKICRHFHLPLQSGDNDVLKRMGRWYNADFFSQVLTRVRHHLPDTGFTTDVIVGFPGETLQNFRNTCRFLETHFNGLHVFPFSDREGTSAVKLSGHCPKPVIRERVQKLLEIDLRLRSKFQNRFAGEERMVLAESDGGFTDNGIRLPFPLPFPDGTMDWAKIPMRPG